MLSKRYKITQLTTDGDLVRVRLDSLSGEGGVHNPLGLNAVVGLRETQISWAIKNGGGDLRLGDTFTLTLEPDSKAG